MGINSWCDTVAAVSAARALLTNALSHWRRRSFYAALRTWNSAIQRVACCRTLARRIIARGVWKLLSRWRVTAGKTAASKRAILLAVQTWRGNAAVMTMRSWKRFTGTCDIAWVALSLWVKRSLA